MSSNVLRHPALLAQQAITVDHISEGRLELGIGCGWFEEEHRRFGIPLYEPGVRVDRFEEALEIIDLLLVGKTVSHGGRHYQLSEARLRPRPVQLPRPPFMLAAHGPRMLRICARYADRWNSFGTVEEMARRNRLLDEACERIGRDPTGISRSLSVEALHHGLPGPARCVVERWRLHGGGGQIRRGRRERVSSSTSPVPTSTRRPSGSFQR